VTLHAAQVRLLTALALAVVGVAVGAGSGTLFAPDDGPGATCFLVGVALVVAAVAVGGDLLTVGEDVVVPVPPETPGPPRAPGAPVRRWSGDDAPWTPTVPLLRLVDVDEVLDHLLARDRGDVLRGGHRELVLSVPHEDLLTVAGCLRDLVDAMHPGELEGVTGFTPPGALAWARRAERAARAQLRAGQEAPVDPRDERHLRLVDWENWALEGDEVAATSDRYLSTVGRMADVRDALWIAEHRDPALMGPLPRHRVTTEAAGQLRARLSRALAEAAGVPS